MIQNLATTNTSAWGTTAATSDNGFNLKLFFNGQLQEILKDKWLKLNHNQFALSNLVLLNRGINHAQIEVLGGHPLPSSPVRIIHQWKSLNYNFSRHMAKVKDILDTQIANNLLHLSWIHKTKFWQHTWSEREPTTWPGTSSQKRAWETSVTSSGETICPK